MTSSTPPLFLLVVTFLFIGCFESNKQKINLDQSVTLICRPSNSMENNKSEAITVFAHRDTIWFPSRSHFENEFFLKEGKLFSNYCLVENDFKKNYCENAGYITFFNGEKLVMSGTELDCEIP